MQLQLSIELILKSLDKNRVADDSSSYLNEDVDGVTVLLSCVDGKTRDRESLKSGYYMKD